MASESVIIRLNEDRSVSGLLLMPSRPSACLVLAHGAGAGMTHAFMASVAACFADRGIATLRYQFPYMEEGSRRPDRPELAQATVRAATDAAASMAPGLPLFAGGKSFGGRMTSQAQATEPLRGVCGLVFFGFPLHPAGKPSVTRATHLSAINVPMLFIQGARDALASADLLGPVLERLGPSATLWMAADADHSLHVPVRSGRTDEQVLHDALDVAAAWIARVGHSLPPLA